MLVLFPANDGQRFDGPFKEFDRITGIQIFEGLYFALLRLSRFESRIMFNRHGLGVRP